jgi:hypothetical protein
LAQHACPASQTHPHPDPRRRFQRQGLLGEQQQQQQGWDSLEREYEYLQRRRPVAVLSALYATTNKMRARGFIVFGLLAASVAKGSDDAMELCKSLPRTLRTLSWALQVGR